MNRTDHVYFWKTVQKIATWAVLTPIVVMFYVLSLVAQAPAQYILFYHDKEEELDLHLRMKIGTIVYAIGYLAMLVYLNWVGGMTHVELLATVFAPYPPAVMFIITLEKGLINDIYKINNKSK